MEELSKQWEDVCHLSVSKQSLLEAALCQAEQFHSSVQAFLGRLMETERKLKSGFIPEEEEALLALKQQHQEHVTSLECERQALDCVVSLGDEILVSCNPESVNTIRTWISTVQQRWQEVMSWVSLQGDRVEAALLSLASERQEMEQLRDWVLAAAESLTLRDQEPLPDEIVQIEELISLHGVRILLSESNAQVCVLCQCPEDSFL
ncbi:microtubule-actin cross-linking factor 1, isoforms 6/7-like [Heterodontus francisci]|uniref:microtubule-actin cross-linking factor 1, isoforms 6/7-like n=1 Tax=Heterodontus francisci TaxID=7792 RepID=UPI00355B12EB